MRKVEFFQAAEQLLLTIETSGIDKLIEKSRLIGRPGSLGPVSPQEILSVVSEYRRQYLALDSHAHEVAEAFGISQLFLEDVWSNVLEASVSQDRKEQRARLDDGSLGFLIDAVRGITFFKENAPRVKLLLLPHSDAESRADQYGDNFEVIRIKLIEDQGETSSPERISQLMSAMDQIYKAIGSILNTDSSDLSVIAIDSGSDKSFDFLGLGKIIEQVNALLFGIYDRSIASRGARNDSFREEVMKTLPVMQLVDKAADDGTLKKDEAGRIRHELLSGIEKLLSVGAIGDNIGEYEAPDLRKLIKAEPKALPAPAQPEKDRKGKKPKKKRKAKKKKSEDE